MKKVVWAFIGIISFLGLVSSMFSGSSQKTSPNIELTPRQSGVIYQANSVQRDVQSQVPLSNDNYYKNSQGIEIHSPANAPSIPYGASAQCRDGTYSFSVNRRGTCSHHGGVSRWY